MYLSKDYLGTRQIIFDNNMNAIGNHFLYQVRGQISFFQNDMNETCQKLLLVMKKSMNYHALKSMMGYLVDNNLLEDTATKNIDFWYEAWKHVLTLRNPVEGHLQQEFADILLPVCKSKADALSLTDCFGESGGWGKDTWVDNQLQL